MQLRKIICALTVLISQAIPVVANLTPNQTDELTPIIQNGSLPFDVEISLMPTQLPNGVHSGSKAIYGGKWFFIGGRTNGLHGFATDNFPPQAQNTSLFVVDPVTWNVWSRSLTDLGSGLTQAQIDTLSVTSPQYFQPNNTGPTLYITGGYGIDTATGLYTTKPILTAIDLPGLMNWVMNPLSSTTAAQFIRQITHPMMQVTGGWMTQIEQDKPILLVFGQNFDGVYNPASSNGVYTEQVRPFNINDNGRFLSVDILPPKPSVPNPNYRRRDLNVVPAILKEKGHYKNRLIAYSGVFTLGTGIWTVPVEIKPNGKSSMANPLKSGTFKQGMSNYICSRLPLFSKSKGSMYTLFFGGISYGYFEDGVFQTDIEFPFINQVTAIQIDKSGTYTQYLLNGTYPLIVSTQSNPGNPLLFGAAAYFFEAPVPLYANEIVNLDAITEPTVVGYIVGGIQSTVPNTFVITDSAASPYIFQVTLVPR